jgi:hypothetical protein
MTTGMLQQVHRRMYKYFKIWFEMKDFSIKLSAGTCTLEQERNIDDKLQRRKEK